MSTRIRTEYVVEDNKLGHTNDIRFKAEGVADIKMWQGDDSILIATRNIVTVIKALRLIRDEVKP